MKRHRGDGTLHTACPPEWPKKPATDSETPEPTLTPPGSQIFANRLIAPSG